MNDWNDAPFDDEQADDGYDEEYDTDTGTWVDWREPMSGGRKVLIALMGVVVALVVAAGALYFWVDRQIDPPGEPGEEVEVEIARGATTQRIGEVLEEHDVITSATIWDYWARFNDKGPFQAGEFTFRRNSSFGEAVAVLEAGPRPPKSDRVTIPEGLTVRETVARLANPETGLERWTADALQAAVDDPTIRSRFQPEGNTSKEGLLFPETYEVGEDTDERAFISGMIAQTDQVLVDLGVEARAAELGRTPYEIIIVASLIEEEARVPEDRAKISRVIHNRLEQGIPLGIDATSRYEAEISGRDREQLDFTSQSPYNTRRVQGLPPTPIAGAGRAAFEAALNPEPGPWIFYVLADAEGHHFFTDSSREFQQAKQECIRLNLGCG